MFTIVRHEYVSGDQKSLQWKVVWWIKAHKYRGSWKEPARRFVNLSEREREREWGKERERESEWERERATQRERERALYTGLGPLTVLASHLISDAVFAKSSPSQKNRCSQKPKVNVEFAVLYLHFSSWLSLPGEGSRGRAEAFQGEHEWGLIDAPATMHHPMQCIVGITMMFLSSGSETE